MISILFQTMSAYLDFMTKVGKLLGGGNETREQMAKVIELEAELAKVKYYSMNVQHKKNKQNKITVLLKGTSALDTS